jgi:hypothetical protein
MAATETKSLWLVEVVWEGAARRSWHNRREEATTALVDLAEILGSYNADTADDAREFLLDDERSAWVDCVEMTTAGVCPKCDAMAGWSGDYCEPCGYQFGEDLDD